MATSTSFKQQCPSCEAMVPIKDKSLVGRKIDCPKCKYRFVVESPGEEEESAEEEKAAAATTTAKATNGKAATGIKKGPPPGKVNKGKAVARKADEDDADGDAKPQKKKSPVLIIGSALAGVALIGLVIGSLYIFGVFDPSGQQAKNNNPGGGKNTGANQDPGDDTKKPPDAPPPPALTDITNLLPNDSQVVFNYNVDKLRNSSLNNAAFKPGAFSEEQFAKTFGFSFRSVTRVVQGLNTDKKTVFSVMRMGAAYDKMKLTASLLLEPQAVGGMSYFKVKRPLDSLGTLLVRANEPADDLALYLHPDGRTLVFADGPLMQDFLGKGAKFDYVSQPQQPPKPPEGGDQPLPPGADPRPGPGGKTPGGLAPPAGPGGVLTPPSGPGGPSAGPGGAGAGGPGGGRRPPGGGGVPPDGIQPFSQPGAGGGQPGGGKQFPQPPGIGGGRDPGAPPGSGLPGPGGGGTPPGIPNDGAGGGSTPPPAGSYMTIKERMKIVLDHLEKADKSVLFSMVTTKPGSFLKELPTHTADILGSNLVPGQKAVVLAPVLEQFKEVDLVGVSLIALNEKKLTAGLVLECRSENAALKLDGSLSALTAVAAPKIGKDVYKLELALAGSDNASATEGGQPGGPFQPFPPGPGGPGGDRRPPPRPKPGGGGVPPDGIQPFGQPPGSGGGRPGPGGGRGPGFPPPGFPGGPGGRGGDPNPPSDAPKPDGTIAISVRDMSVDVILDVNLKSYAYDKIVSSLTQKMMQLKGVAALVENRSHVHELAAALKRYVDANKQFPRGTAFRAPGNRPLDYPPTQRVSWMAELLPYLGDGAYAALPRDNEMSWNEGDNLLLAQVIIPQFVGDGKNLAMPLVAYPGTPALVAATHFVGVAGLGLDAAEYEATDAAVAKKLGIFGYQRQTKLEDIKDGPANTIAVLMVPPTAKTPWLAGGGSTVRGISDDDTDDGVVLPFVCVKYDGQDGTFAIMGDGAVRFIPKSINPKVFRAMCTINGGESIPDLDKVAPVVPPPDDPNAGLKDRLAVPPAKTEVPPAPVPEKPTPPPPAGDKAPPPPAVGRPMPPPNGTATTPVPPTAVPIPPGGAVPAVPPMPPPGKIGGGIRPGLPVAPGGGQPTPPGAGAPQ